MANQQNYLIELDSWDYLQLLVLKPKMWNCNLSIITSNRATICKTNKQKKHSVIQIKEKDAEIIYFYDIACLKQGWSLPLLCVPLSRSHAATITVYALWNRQKEGGQRLSRCTLIQKLRYAQFKMWTCTWCGVYTETQIWVTHKETHEWSQTTMGK